jgi:hypothetical protein
MSSNPRAHHAPALWRHAAEVPALESPAHGVAQAQFKVGSTDRRSVEQRQLALSATRAAPRASGPPSSEQ